MYGNEVTRDLDAVMEFGRVIRVHGDGTVTDNHGDVDAPEGVYLRLNADGQSPDDDYEGSPEGWEPFTAGYTGQHGYGGPTMHRSEFIGGRLARDILSTPGYYV